MVRRGGQWWALAVLVLPVLLISVDTTVLGFALPYLSEDLAPTGAEQLWIVDVYSFVLAGLLVFMGTLGDRIGRRRLLLIGGAAFGAASVLAAFATSPLMLIVARALLGVGGATLMPSTLSLIRSIFTEDRTRRTAVAIWSAAFSGGMAVGPVVGGWLLEHFWWGSVFLINVPVMVLLLVAGPLLLPEFRDPNPGRFDPWSALLSLGTMLPVVYGVKIAATEGISWSAGAAMVLGLALGAAFVRRQRRLDQPMLDLGLFANRKFAGSVITNLLGVFALVGLLFLLPQYLQLVLGLKPLAAALWMLPATVAGVVGALAAAWLARRVRVPVLVSLGLLLGAAGFLVLTTIGADAGLAAVVVAFVLVGGGVALSETLTNDLVISAAPVNRAGAASAISETGYELGGALGTALLGSLATAVYQSGLPATAPAAAHDTLGGAVATAHSLPATEGAELLTTAREAFVTALHTSAWVGAAILVYTALQAYFLLGRRRNRPQDSKPEEPAMCA
ncbi:MFS transporter [Amycolatopsis sp. Poz14]|uniref:MFS transporter n=1 Tax=Amycolatopsis sp. Poz14 TaxID=1447705 RepID=UPI001EE7E49E|nr:MFS transporter [Amycolatopsis sp. Poz14]MCG3749748.1 MFS transporter [Amycolatopsis sp. Poz14]